VIGADGEGMGDAMRLTGLHLLLTYRCDLQCDHCFVWGAPSQVGTMTLETIRQALDQAKDLGTVKWIYFEGGEPFLYYPVLLQGVRRAASMGFRVGVLSDCYWATGREDALEWLKPLVGLVEDFSISTDRYHGDEDLTPQARHAREAAAELGLPAGLICIAQPEAAEAAAAVGQLPKGESAVMYRGRAAVKLVPRASRQPWERFTTCPYENLRDPARVHLDPLGNLHACQGLSIGNIFHSSLREICETFDPDRHPIIAPLLAGGPAELIRRYSLAHEEGYADACHSCYEARKALRPRFPEILGPDQMYGVLEGWAPRGSGGEAAVPG